MAWKNEQVVVACVNELLRIGSGFQRVDHKDFENCLLILRQNLNLCDVNEHVALQLAQDLEIMRNVRTINVDR